MESFLQGRLDAPWPPSCPAALPISHQLRVTTAASSEGRRGRHQPRLQKFRGHRSIQ